MTPEEQRIAIAEWCGWTFPKEDGYELLWAVRPKGVEASPGPVERDRIHKFIPDYLNDLNAMHEAEGRLNEEECDHYGLRINQIMDRDQSGKVSDYCDWHATAAQRAEALLRTTGKWKETK